MLPRQGAGTLVWESRGRVWQAYSSGVERPSAVPQKSLLLLWTQLLWQQDKRAAPGEFFFPYAHSPAPPWGAGEIVLCWNGWAVAVLQKDHFVASAGTWAMQKSHSLLKYPAQWIAVSWVSLEVFLSKLWPAHCLHCIVNTAVMVWEGLGVH